MEQPTSQVLKALLSAGLLLQQDKHALNVVTLVTGETLRGSWWSHPKGRVIFGVLSELAEQADILFAKLLYRKVTLVHRKLWPAFLAVASQSDPWQLQGLSVPARRLLASVHRSTAPVRSSGTVVKELEVRLLAHSQEVHTDSGQHEIVLQSWPAWARHTGVKPQQSVARAKQQIEDAASAIGASLSALPWHSKKGAAT